MVKVYLYAPKGNYDSKQLQTLFKTLQSDVAVYTQTPRQNISVIFKPEMVCAVSFLVVDVLGSDIFISSRNLSQLEQTYVSYLPKGA